MFADLVRDPFPRRFTLVCSDELTTEIFGGNPVAVGVWFPNGSGVLLWNGRSQFLETYDSFSDIETIQHMSVSWID